LVNTKIKIKMILGCLRPKLFFSGLPNLLPQKIRLPLISFFSGVSFGRITTTFTTIIQKAGSAIENAEAGSALELQQNCRQTNARTD
jgi:hypothetical protein